MNPEKNNSSLNLNLTLRRRQRDYARIAYVRQTLDSTHRRISGALTVRQLFQVLTCVLIFQVCVPTWIKAGSKQNLGGLRQQVRF